LKPRLLTILLTICLIWLSIFAIQRLIFKDKYANKGIKSNPVEVIDEKTLSDGDFFKNLSNKYNKLNPDNRDGYCKVSKDEKGMYAIGVDNFSFLQTRGRLASILKLRIEQILGRITTLCGERLNKVAKVEIHYKKEAEMSHNLLVSVSAEYEAEFIPNMPLDTVCEEGRFGKDEILYCKDIRWKKKTIYDNASDKEVFTYVKIKDSWEK